MPTSSFEPVTLPGQVLAEEEEPKKSDDIVIDASTFIKIVRYHHLTGSEFLSLLGNSKISNKAYQEIETNPDLTVKRLIEILEESSLTPADYEKLTIAIQRNAKLKEEAKTKLGTSVIEPVLEPMSAIETIPESFISPMQQEQPASMPTEPEEYSYEKAEEESPRGVPMPMLFEEGEEDGYHDEEKGAVEYDENGRRRTNTGKIVFSAFAALLLIALSFGIRWYFTGSWLPTEKDVQPADLVLDENGIYNALSVLPAPAAPAFAESKTYTAGSGVEQKALLTSVVMNNRFIYFYDNILYIFEKLGGQLEQLEARHYVDGIQILGLLKLDSGVAVVTSYEGNAYSFTYTVPSETEGEAGTTLSSTVQRPETVIELLDSQKPEDSGSVRLFGFSGSLADLWTEGDRIIAVTSESLAQGAAGQDAYSFMPYVYTPYGEGTDNKILCKAEDVFVPSDGQYSGFASVFSLDAATGLYSIAAVAGGSGQFVSRSGSDLFIGQNDLLVRYSLSGGITENGFCTFTGSFGSFSTVGKADDVIRVTVLENGAGSLFVLDSELNILSDVQNLGNGEALLATCFYGSETYIITESGILYGINGNNEPLTASSAVVTNDAIYRWNDKVGIRIDPMGDPDKRTGLSVTTLSLDGSLRVISTLEISSRTVAEQALDEYLTSPAETNVTALGANPEEGILVVPVVYFDGVSEVERFVICTLTEEGDLALVGSICEYDRQSSLLFASVEGGNVIAVTGDRLITAKADDASIVGYFNSQDSSAVYSYYG